MTGERRRNGARRLLFWGVLLCGAGLVVLALRLQSEAAQHEPAQPSSSRSATPEADVAPDGVRDLPRAAQLVRDARAQSEVGQWAGAIATLQQAIRTGGYDENVSYLLGSWMENHAPPEASISYWSAEVHTDPKPQTAYYYWAAALEHSGDDAGALAMLARALEVDPAHELSELRTAQILARQGKLDLALAHCTLATRIFPDFAQAHQFCAKLLSSLGRNAEAERELALAKTSNPQTPRRYLYWARYLAEKGRTDAALSELSRALAQDPNDAEASALAAQLRQSRTAGASSAAP